jgi:single-strand DNA-binding protein
MWGKTAETFAEKIKKGDRVLVVGRMQTRVWEKDGQKQYRTELVADRVLPQGTPMRASPVRAANDSEIEEDFEGFE